MYVLIFIISIFLGFGNYVLYNQLSVKEVIISGSVAHLTQEELILNSELIITGTVTKINESKWRNLGNDKDGRVNVLQTDIEIKIDEIVSGEYDLDTVTVRVDKGYDKAARTRYISDGFPDFYEGENVLMFLSRDEGVMKTDENYFLSTGMFQGKWSLDKKNGMVENARTVADYELEHKTVGELTAKVKQTIEKNPNYRVEKELKKEETRKRNIELFGE